MADVSFAERAAFIAHFRPLQPLWQFQNDGTGGFHNQCTEWAWIGWQAARAASAPAQSEDPPCGHMLRGIRKSYCERCQRAASGLNVPVPTTNAIRQAEADLAEMRAHGNADDVQEALAQLERLRASGVKGDGRG